MNSGHHNRSPVACLDPPLLRSIRKMLAATDREQSFDQLSLGSCGVLMHHDRLDVVAPEVPRRFLSRDPHVLGIGRHEGADERRSKDSRPAIRGEPDAMPPMIGL